MQIEITRRDVIWSYMGTIVSMGANFFMLPFLMYFLTPDMLGLWYVLVSMGNITALFDFGFAVTFARNITYCWSGANELKKEGVVFSENSEPNYALMKEVLSASKIIYASISVTALLILITAGSLYVRYITRNSGSNVPVIAWLIYAFAVFLNLYYGYYGTFLHGVGAITQANKNMLYARAAHIILMIIFLFMGFGIIGASCAYLVYGLVLRLLGKYHFYKYKDIGKNLAKVQTKTSLAKLKEVFITVWHNAWRDGLISICDYLCSQASVIICSVYMPLSQTGIYSIGVQIATAINHISKTLYGAKQPEIQNAYIMSDRAKIRSIMKYIVFTFIGLFIMGVTGFILVGRPLLKLVKPGAVVSVPVFLGIALYNIMLGFRDCYASYFSCTNRIVYLKAYIISAISGVALSFIAMGIFDLGVWGLICAQIISQLSYNVWYWPLKAIREIYYD
ncbi:MAG: hypothetical protein IJG34_09095 [Synergistaceae bacterium]|nr:hypothetical protein [Synergistaceae bacterium]MBQ3450034.1 hypothetical protein [Synergistaceae bacterium]MBQ3693239.1 hypothetical protein [Synergistaceae bacterium]MBQ9627800.1 hypothetical protein [Synergistaceae bacterium]MBR0250168.1 hypothetical protein [Synergistaceae bacterium]